MRFGFAIASLVLAGVLLILGIGQRTFLAGPSEIVYQTQPGDQAEYSVIRGSELHSVRGQANVEVAGDAGFVAVGSSTDVDAWVEPFAHSVLAGDAELDQFVEAEAVPAGNPDFTAELSDEDLAAIDPRGSDLWISEQSGSGTKPISLEADESLLVGGAGQVSIVWVQDRRTPWAGPLLAAGGFFAVVGGVLYLLAVDHNRRGLGPRRGRRGPLQGIRSMFAPRANRGGSRSASPDSGEAQGAAAAPEKKGRGRTRAKRLALPALGIALVLGVSGCSASYWPGAVSDRTSEEPSGDEPAPNIAPIPITQPQIDRIIGNIVDVAGTGDAELDVEPLETRFTGDALAQRKANYKIRKKVDDYEVVLPRITDEQLGYELVQSTEGWPRTVFVTLASESADDADASDTADDKAADAEGAAEDAEEPHSSPSLAMVMTQADPLQNYRVSRIFALRGGIAMPEAAPSDEGTALLAPDLKSLALPPAEVGAAYADILVGKKDTEQAALFDLEGDSIVEKSGAAWVKAAKAEAKKDKSDVKYSVKAAQTDASILSLSTGVGGALVATTVHESRIEAKGGDYRPKAVGAVTALSGLKGPQNRIVSTVSHQLLFFVPSGTSGDRIQLLGYTTELVGAKK